MLGPNTRGVIHETRESGADPIWTLQPAVLQTANRLAQAGIDAICGLILVGSKLSEA